jgi:hypothetical protein
LTVFAADVLTDKRWDEFLSRHPRAGVFHSRGWLEALQQTYHYRPTLLTSSPPGEPLRNGLVLCDVRSWLTGRRLVSLPFSDHCDILSDNAADERELRGFLPDYAARQGCRYAELRPSGGCEEASGDWHAAQQFCLHRLLLDPPADKLFSELHKDCIQRKVRRAEREALHYEKGSSEALLRTFYGLMLRTRRRHCLPPQPYRWFQSLMTAMGDSLTIRLASKDHQPAAAILTLSYKSTLTYKYGCSDERFNALGGTPFLFWKAIEEAKAEGMKEFDLGRSDLDNQGLITFKDRLGAQRTGLTYWRCSGGETGQSRRPAWLTQAAKHVFRRLPDALLVASGRFLYKHIG